MRRIPVCSLPFALCLYSLISGCNPRGQAVPKEPPAPNSATPTSSARAPAAGAPPADEPRGGPSQVAAEHATAIVAASDRSEADRQLDAGRRPAELLGFFEIMPGQSVAELGAGGGYTAELLARAVGPAGRVVAQNTPFILERFAREPWEERLAKPVMANVTPVISEFDAPLPPTERGLDAVLLVLFYHDTVWMGTDRSAMNRNIYDALAPGGVYGVVDHSALPGAGTTVAKKLHRIEQSVVVDEVSSAGFVLESEGAFLANPQDERDWNASPSVAGERRGSSDRFVLKFRKPR